MASNYPPDNFEVTNGTWGTEVDRSETGSEFGGYAIDFKNVATPSGGVILATVSEFPAIGNMTYFLTSRVNPGGNGASQGLRMDVEEFDQSGSSLGSTNMFSAPPAGTGAFETVGGSIKTQATTRSMKVSFGKADAYTPNAQVIWDNISVTEAPDYFTAQHVGAFAIAAATWSPHTSLAAGPGWAGGGVFSGNANSPRISLAAGVFTVQEPGMYAVTVAGHFPQVLTGNNYGVRVVAGGGALIPQTYYGNRISDGNSAFAHAPVTVFSRIIYLPIPYGTITPQFYRHQSGSSVDDVEVTIAKVS